MQASIGIRFQPDESLPNELHIEFTLFVIGLNESGDPKHTMVRRRNHPGYLRHLIVVDILACQCPARIWLAQFFLNVKPRVPTSKPA
jgi:hypothetical protein